MNSADASVGHLPALLALNLAHETETSPLDPAQLAQLVARSCCTLVAADGRDGFLLALDQDADYGSANFAWFRKRYDRFVYIDRIIVAPQSRGRGIARGLYQALLARATAAGHRIVACEVNLQPANPGSIAFHAALGFGEVGRACPHAGKRVAYLVRQLEPESTML